MNKNKMHIWPVVLYVLLLTAITSCREKIDKIKFLERNLGIELNDNYEIIHNGKNNSWRKDVVTIDLTIKIKEDFIDSIVEQIINHKYYNSNINCCVYDSIYIVDKILIDEFYTYYHQKTSNVKNIKEFTLGQYQIDYLSYKHVLFEGKWMKKENQTFEFTEIYDNTGGVHKSATLNKFSRELTYNVWPSP
jgi:hypothetical protein